MLTKDWWTYSLNEFKTDKELWDHYAICLRYMDWDYQYADDSFYYHRGVKQKYYLDSLRKVVVQLDAKRANEMYEEARCGGGEL